MEYTLFYVNGGLGKNILATALLPYIKEKYDNKIVVVASWIEPFKEHPLVDKFFKATSTFNIYDDIVKKAIILKSEPYDSHYFIHKQKNLITSWLYQLNLIDNKTTIDPQPFVTKAQQIILDTINEQFETIEKPFLIQPFGGTIFNNETAYQKSFEQTRNMSESFLAKAIDKIKENYTPVIIQSKPHRSFHNAINANLNEYQLVQLASFGYPALLIDSSMQHAYAAFNNPATVIWSGTSPDLLGYRLHKNIRVNNCLEPECHRPYSFLGDMLDNHQTWQCPYGKTCQDHDINLVIKSF